MVNQKPLRTREWHIRMFYVSFIVAFDVYKCIKKIIAYIILIQVHAAQGVQIKDETHIYLGGYLTFSLKSWMPDIRPEKPNGCNFFVSIFFLTFFDQYNFLTFIQYPTKSDIGPEYPATSRFRYSSGYRISSGRISCPSLVPIDHTIKREMITLERRRLVLDLWWTFYLLRLVNI